MGLAILAEALARIEHKVDALCRWTGAAVYPMQFEGNACPSCNQVVNYQVDVAHQVVVRRCGCSTGKVPSVIPLVPVAPPTGAPNGYPTAVDVEPADGTDDRPRRKAR